MEKLQRNQDAIYAMHGWIRNIYKFFKKYILDAQCLFV